MIQDKELDALLTTFQPVEPTDSAEFMSEFEKRLNAIDIALAYHRAEVERARKKAVWAFATGTVAGLILAIIALALPSPVEMIAFSIHSRFLLTFLEYVPYVMMFFCATSIAFGIIEFMNRSEEMENLLAEMKKYEKFAYNVQVCTDTESKMICGINVVQYPTDHYQLPAVVEQSIENLQKKPVIVSADCIYGTLYNLYYLKQKGISVRIPTSKQSNNAIGKKSENKYAIEYFVFDEKRNVFICPEKQELTQDGIYDAQMQKGGFVKKKIIYSNYQACKDCPNKSKCTKSQHRTITRYVHELSLEAEQIMNTKEGQEDYKQRSRTVEAHNGTFIQVYNYDRLQVVGLEKTQEVMFKIAAAYNTIRLFNITQKEGIDLSYVINKIQSI